MQPFRCSTFIMPPTIRGSQGRETSEERDEESGGKSVNIEPANRRAFEQAKVRGNQDQGRKTQRRKEASLRAGKQLEQASMRAGGSSRWGIGRWGERGKVRWAWSSAQSEQRGAKGRDARARLKNSNFISIG